jgi:acyl-CoA hydrolase
LVDAGSAAARQAARGFVVRVVAGADGLHLLEPIRITQQREKR